VAKQRKNEQDNKNADYLEISRIANHLAELAKLQMHLIGELKKHLEKPKAGSSGL